jgi:hypothetical protein
MNEANDADLERLEDVAWDRDRALGRIERGTGRMISGLIAMGLGPVAAVYMAPFAVVLAVSWIPGAAWVFRGALDRVRGKRDLRDATARLELPAARLLR